MAMREAVAVDFMGVGTGNGRRSQDAAVRSESQRGGRLVKPIPNGGHARRSPSASEAGESSTHPFASPSDNLHGVRKQPWNRLHAAGRFTQSDEDSHSGGMAVVSPKRERASPDAPLHAPHHPSLQSDNSAPASPSHTPAGEFWRIQQPQARKMQTMYAGHRQAASRGTTQQAGAQRTSPFQDEASQRGARPAPEHNLATQPQPPSSQGAFGSPTPFHFQANGAAAMAAKRSPFQNYPFQATNSPGHAVARPAPGGGKQPSTAQLTIFYAGMVNVYDDVPFDKAQAIMLLAGSGNTWSSNYMNPPASDAARRNPFLKTPMAVPQSTPSTPGSPMASQQAPTSSAQQPGQPPGPGVVFSNSRQPPITNVELPQARKASLARFLEKRKDRVRKAPVNEEGEPAASASRDKSPGPERSAPSVRTTRSPSPVVQDHHRSSPPMGLRHDAPSGSEPSSSPTRPPGTPPRQNMLESESKRTPTPKRRDIATDQRTEQHSSKRARSGRSPHRLPDPDESSSL